MINGGIPGKTSIQKVLKTMLIQKCLKPAFFLMARTLLLLPVLMLSVKALLISLWCQSPVYLMQHFVNRGPVSIQRANKAYVHSGVATLSLTTTLCSIPLFVSQLKSIVYAHLMAAAQS